MPLSNKWNMTDNVYTQSRMNQITILSYNNGVMGIFEKKHDFKVNKCIIDFAKCNNRSETLLFNNRLFLNIINPSDVQKQQYNTNREYILKLFNI